MSVAKLNTSTPGETSTMPAEVTDFIGDGDGPTRDQGQVAEDSSSGSSAAMIALVGVVCVAYFVM